MPETESYCRRLYRCVVYVPCARCVHMCVHMCVVCVCELMHACLCLCVCVCVCVYTICYILCRCTVSEVWCVDLLSYHHVKLQRAVLNDVILCVHVVIIGNFRYSSGMVQNALRQQQALRLTNSEPCLMWKLSPTWFTFTYWSQCVCVCVQARMCMCVCLCVIFCN